MSGFKYIGSSPGPNLKVGSVGCEKASLTGMVINDEVAAMCWSVTGLKVKIQNSTMAVQEGMEVINFNFSQSESSPAVPSQLGLPGRIA